MRGLLFLTVLVPAMAAAQTAPKPAAAVKSAAPAAYITPPPPPVTLIPAPPIYSTIQPRRIACFKGCLSPAEAIALIGKVGPKAGVAGEFDFRVVGVGEDQGSIFLNSMADYRSPDCLTIRIPAQVVRQITGSTTLEAARAYFMGTRVVVGGEAWQVRIDLTEDGKRTGKFYFQNHVAVSNPAQFAIIEK